MAIFLPGGWRRGGLALPLRLNHGHPLSQGLVGVWSGAHGLPQLNVTGYVFTPELMRGLASDALVAIDSPVARQRPTAAGPAVYVNLQSQSAISDALRPSERVSLFWYGAFHGATGSFNPAICGVYHNTSGSAPYYSYALARPNDNDLWVAYNNAGTFGNLTQANVISSTPYEVPMALGATFGLGAVKGYKNGREIMTGSGISGITYDSTARFVLDRHIQFSFTAAAMTALCLVYNRELSPTEHAQLADDPFQVFLPQSLEWQPFVETQALVSQDVIEILSQPFPDAWISQDVIELLTLNVTDASVTTSFLSSTSTLTAPTIEAAPGGAFISSTLTLFAPTIAIELAVFTPFRIFGTTLTAPTVGNYDILTDLIASSTLLNSPSITTELPEFSFNPLSIWP